MKNIGKIAILGAVVAASASFASASTITLGSYSSTGSAITADNNSALTYAGVDLTGTMPTGTVGTLSAPGSASTYTLAPNGAWSNPLPNSTWVGEAANAGPGGVNPAYGYYEFTTNFSATAGTYMLNLSVMADDTVEVLLNGSQIIPFGALGTDTHCADNAPSCLISEVYNFAGIESLGTSNTLEFIVEQAGNEAPGTDPSGVDFSGTATATPEPSSLMLLGTGLCSAAGMLFRRRVNA